MGRDLYVASSDDHTELMCMDQDDMKAVVNVFRRLGDVAYDDVYSWDDVMDFLQTAIRDNDNDTVILMSNVVANITYNVPPKFVRLSTSSI